MKTIVGLFDTFYEAKKAATDLEAAGISHNDISIVANNETGQYTVSSTDNVTTGEPHVSGNAIGHDAVVGAISASAVNTNVDVTRSVNAQGETVLPVVEETIALGKREVQSGGVRVYSHVTETPVQESINLREEHVTVERHAVNRPVSAADMNNLRDGVIEVTETSEVPVVSKEARIVEEVVVGKEATQRAEIVYDMVRRTDVEVERLGREASTSLTGDGGSGDGILGPD